MPKSISASRQRTILRITRAKLFQRALSVSEILQLAGGPRTVPVRSTWAGRGVLEKSERVQARLPAANRDGSRSAAALRPSAADSELFEAASFCSDPNRARG